MHEMVVAGREAAARGGDGAREGNQSRAAEWLGINRNTLRRKLGDHKLQMNQGTHPILPSPPCYRSPTRPASSNSPSACTVADVKLLSTGGTAKLLLEPACRSPRWPSTPAFPR
jgi:hypothetical protein